MTTKTYKITQYIRVVDEEALKAHGAEAAGLNNLTDAQTSYIETALWSSTDDEGEPLDDNYGVEDIPPEELLKLLESLEDFLEEHRDLIFVNNLKPEQVAHDFWLTRNGHGAGFWDGDYPEPLGEKLTESSKVHGSVDLYIGDDGKVYVT